MTNLYRTIYRHLNHPADVVVPILCALTFAASFGAVLVLILRAAS